MLIIETAKIIEVMNKLDDLPYQKVMFDGKWGIGKTKYIMNSIFFNSFTNYCQCYFYRFYIVNV